jgi:soluble lytic murein transglycosylase-like protein
MKKEDRYDSLIMWYAEKCHLEFKQIKAQLMAESGMDPDAVSPVGAMGLGQFMPRTWEEWRDGTPGVQELTGRNTLLAFDPEDNIAATCAYMAWLLWALDGDMPDALRAYNYGIGNVKRWIEDGRNYNELPKETQNYVDRICKLIINFKGQG